MYIDFSLYFIPVRPISFQQPQTLFNWEKNESCTRQDYSCAVWRPVLEKLVEESMFSQCLTVDILLTLYLLVPVGEIC